MTSSPASTHASIVASIASVEPQHTVTCVSASMGTSKRRVKCAAMAWRRPRAPAAIEYWLTSFRIASHAARFSTSGAGKSGKP
jgi:hypothetical protein